MATKDKAGPFRENEDRYEVLYCPMQDCQERLKPFAITSIGRPKPMDDEGLEPPYYQYVCAKHGAAFTYGSRRTKVDPT